MGLFRRRIKPPYPDMEYLPFTGVYHKVFQGQFVKERQKYLTGFYSILGEFIKDYQVQQLIMKHNKYAGFIALPNDAQVIENDIADYFYKQIFYFLDELKKQGRQLPDPSEFGFRADKTDKKILLHNYNKGWIIDVIGFRDLSLMHDLAKDFGQRLRLTEIMVYIPDKTLYFLYPFYRQHSKVYEFIFGKDIKVK